MARDIYEQEDELYADDDYDDEFEDEEEDDEEEE